MSPAERQRRPQLQFALWSLVLLVVFSLSLAWGSVSIPLADLVAILCGDPPSTPSQSAIVWQFRLPKALAAAFSGAALAVSGLLLQTLFRNPLAGPSVLGVSAGASLGVAIVVLATGGGAIRWLGDLGRLGDLGVISAASLGAVGVLGLIVLAARRASTLVLLILGLLVGYATSALVTILLHFSLAERIQTFVVWSFGSFGGVTRAQLEVLLPVLASGLVLALMLAKSLNALLLGETTANSLGLAVRRVRGLILVTTALLSGAVTAFCGPVAFLDVAVPHLARGLFRSADHRVLLPATALLGAVLAVVADLVAQLPGSQAVLPLNAVTALLGVPVILVVVLQQRVLEVSFE